MNKIFIKQIILFVILVFIGTNNVFAKENTDNRHVKVIEIKDLDRFELDTGEVIELYGVSTKSYEADARKINNFDIIKRNFKEVFKVDSNNGEIYSMRVEYKNGIRFLEKLIKDKDIMLKKTSDGKYLAEVNGVNINKMLIQRGYLKVNDDLNNEDIDAQLLTVEDEAMQSKLGLWKQEFEFGLTSSLSKGGESYIGSGIMFGYIILTVISFYKAFKNLKFIGIFYILAFLNLSFFFGVDVFNNKIAMIEITILAIINFLFTLLLIYRSYKKAEKKWFYKTFVGLIIIVVTIISFFAGIYYGASNTESTSSSQKRYIVAGGYYDNEPIFIKPDFNYLEVPMDYYNESNLDNGTMRIYKLSSLDALYFSSVTFFTVGYGDIIPKGTMRNWAMLEMGCGYFFQTIIIAIIISNFKLEDLFVFKRERKL